MGTETSVRVDQVVALPAVLTGGAATLIHLHLTEGASVATQTRTVEAIHHVLQTIEPVIMILYGIYIY